MDPASDGLRDPATEPASDGLRDPATDGGLDAPGIDGALMPFLHLRVLDHNFLNFSYLQKFYLIYYLHLLKILILILLHLLNTLILILV